MTISQDVPSSSAEEFDSSDGASKALTQELPFVLGIQDEASGTTTGKSQFGASAYDYQTNRLGIGTSNPTLPLQVAGTVGPVSDNASDLGTPELRWRDLHLGPSSLHLQSTAAETGTARSWSLGIETAGSGQGSLRVQEGSTTHLTIEPSGKTSVLAGFSVAKDAAIGGALTVSSTTTLTGPVTTKASASVGTTLSVGTGAQVGSGGTPNDLTALSNNSLYVQGATEIDGALYVDGATDLDGSLDVAGATVLRETLGVTGATTLSSTLTVTGATTLSSTLAVTGTSTLTGAVTTVGALTVGTDLTISGNDLTFGNGESIANTTDGTITITGDLLVSGSQVYTGGSSFSGAVTVAGLTTLNGGITADSGVFTVADSSGNLHTSGTLDVDGASDLAGAISAGSTLAVTGATTLSSTLAVSGATTLSSTLAVTGATTLGGTLTLSNNTLSCTACIDATDLASDSVEAAEIATGAVTTAEILDGTILAADISADVIDLTELKDSLALDGTLTLTGTAGETISLIRTLTDATAENGTTLTVTAADTTSGTTAQYGLYVDNAASTEGLDALLVLDNSDLDDAVGAAITLIDAGGGFTNVFNNAGTLISGSELNVLDAGLVYSELTFSNNIVAGDLAADSVEASEIATGAVATAEILDGTIANADVSTSAAIVYSKLSLSGSIVTGDIADDTIGAGDIATGAVTTTEIADGTVSTTDIADGTIATEDIATGGVATADILDGTILAADISADVIDLTELKDSLALDGTLTLTGTAGETISLVRTLTDATAENGTTLTVTASDTTSGTAAQYGLYLDNAASTEGLDSLLVLDNSDLDDAVGAAITIVNAGGGFTNVINNAGTLISGTELNLLDGKTTLVDTDDAAATAIVGTSALNAGSITSGFGSIDVGTDTITTTGTVGTAGSTVFTGNIGTFAGALAANGGITFDAATDTLGAFTAGGTIDLGGNILTNIGNTGTDFIASTGALTLAGTLTLSNNTLSCTACIDATDLGANSVDDSELVDSLTYSGILTVSGTAGFTNDVDFTLAGTENLAITHDAGGTADVLSLAITPSGTVGTVQGLKIDQVNHVTNTNGLDVAIEIDNSDTDLAIGTAIKLTSAGGGFTTLIDNAGTLISGAELNLLDGGIALSELTDSGTLTVGTVDLNGGAIDGATVGATSASSGAFTTISASTDLTVTVADGNTANLDGDGSPTTDLFAIGVGDTSTTDGVDALQLTFGVSAASGTVINITPSYADATAGATPETYHVINIDAFTATQNADGDDGTVRGLNIGTLTETLTAGTISSTGIYIDTGWDAGIYSASAIQSNGGFDTGGPAALNIGETNATSVTITPATTVTGLLTASTDLTVTVADGNTVNLDGDGSPTADLFVIGAGDTSATNGVDALLVDFDVAAGVSGDAIDITSSVAAQDGSDSFIAIDINVTGANHTGITNTITALDLALTTPDADSTESAIVIGSNWDNSITIASGELLMSGGNLQLNDNINATFGTGDDLTIVHNGTDTLLTNTTGDLVFDNQDVDDEIIFTLGADTSATTLIIENNSGSDLFTFSAAGALQVGPYGTGAGNTGEIQYLELAANGSNYVAFKAPDSIAGNVTWTLPSADGSDGQVLETNGTGALSWTSREREGIFIPAQIENNNLWTAVAGTWGTNAVSANALYGRNVENSTNALNDEIKKSLIQVPSTGTYAMRVIHTQSTNRAIVTVSLGGASKGTYDGYSASAVWNKWTDEISLGTLTAGTEYEISLKATSKHASSSTYYISFQGVKLYRTD